MFGVDNEASISV